MGEIHRVGQSMRFCDSNLAAQIGQLVIAAAFVIECGIGAFLSFLNES